MVSVSNLGVIVSDCVFYKYPAKFEPYLLETFASLSTSLFDINSFNVVDSVDAVDNVRCF